MTARPITGYWFAFTCPHCGGEVDHVADGRPIAGTEASAVCRCARCDRHWHVLTTVRPVIHPESVARRDKRKKATA